MKREIDEDRARGLMQGLLLGDAHQELQQQNGPAHGTCAAQLACFTLEGLIRGSNRASHKGICHPPSVVWHAWCRWAHGQGLGPDYAKHWSYMGGMSWPDGWLWQVQPLTRRRGAAPATVTALRRSPELPDRPVGTSGGHHCLTRALPVALFGASLDDAPDLAADLTRLTHGHPGAATAAGDAVALTVELIHGAPRAVGPSESGGAGPRGTARHALHHGRNAAAHADNVLDAIQLAAPHGHGAITTAAALFGAAHGLRALPADGLGRLEIGWVADRLARDAIEDVTTHPGGSEYTAPSDPTWWSRYPGW